MEQDKIDFLKKLEEEEEKLEAFESYTKEKQKAAVTLQDQDSDMADIGHETFPGLFLELLYFALKWLSVAICYIKKENCSERDLAKVSTSVDPIQCLTCPPTQTNTSLTGTSVCLHVSTVVSILS